jgi:hypothetical protein
MGFNLVIMESPTKAKTVGKYLGPDYVVKACRGHLRDLPKSTLGVDIENNFTPEYVPLADRGDIIAELKKEAGDILWQLAGLCRVMGWDLEDVAQGNLDKLAARKEAGTIDGSGDGIIRGK